MNSAIRSATSELSVVPLTTRGRLPGFAFPSIPLSAASATAPNRKLNATAHKPTSSRYTGRASCHVRMDNAQFFDLVRHLNLHCGVWQRPDPEQRFIVLRILIVEDDTSLVEGLKK